MLSAQLPLCTPFPGYLSVLVMDNARIHHGDEILALTERFGNISNHIAASFTYSLYRGTHRVPPTVLA